MSAIRTLIATGRHSHMIGTSLATNPIITKPIAISSGAAPMTMSATISAGRVAAMWMAVKRWTSPHISMRAVCHATTRASLLAQRQTIVEPRSLYSFPRKLKPTFRCDGRGRQVNFG